MANTAFGHDATLTTPGSTTDTALVRWANTSGTSLNNTINILSDGSNITLNARGEVRFSDADSTHYIAFESPATVSTSYTMTLPADLPAADEVLTVTSYSSGAGVLEWAAAGGTTINTNADNRIITGSGTANTLNGESNLTFSTDLTITSGNVVMATAGKGIDFSAQTGTGSGTLGSELLSHYEQGTFTPTLQDGSYSNSESVSYNSQDASYQRVGNRVHFFIYLHVNSLGSLTGGDYAVIGGMPFAAKNSTGYYQALTVGNFGSGAITAGYSVSARIGLNESFIRMEIFDVTTGTTQLTVSEFSADGNMTVAGTYEV